MRQGRAAAIGAPASCGALSGFAGASRSKRTRLPCQSMSSVTISSGFASTSRFAAAARSSVEATLSSAK